MKPTIGSIVLYCDCTDKNRKPQAWPAIVFAVRTEKFVDLIIFNDDGATPQHDVRFGNEDTWYSWYWPEIKK